MANNHPRKTYNPTNVVNARRFDPMEPMAAVPGGLLFPFLLGIVTFRRAFAQTHRIQEKPVEDEDR